MTVFGRDLLTSRALTVLSSLKRRVASLHRSYSEIMVDMQTLVAYVTKFLQLARLILFAAACILPVHINTSAKLHGKKSYDFTNQFCLRVQL